MATKQADGFTLKLALVGFLTGGFIGYLYRPSAFIIGQLPFDVVITRGANLKGIEQVFIPLAQASFNHMVALAAIGAACGVILGLLLSKK